VDKDRVNVFWDYMESYTEPIADEILNIRTMPKGEARRSAMRKIRKQLANNPYVLDPKDFQDKVRASRALSKALGMLPKERVSVEKTVSNLRDIQKGISDDRAFSRALKQLAKHTGMDEKSLMRNMAELDIATERLPEYVRAMTDLVDSKISKMTELSNRVLTKIKEMGKLDISTKEYREWLTTFGSVVEVYEAVSAFRGNIARAMRSMQETSTRGGKSYLEQYASYATRSEAQDEGATLFMKAVDMTNKRKDSIAKNGGKSSVIATAGDQELFTKELIKMIQNSTTEKRARKMVAKSYKKPTPTLIDVYIAQGISNMLGSTSTIGKIALSTNMMLLYKQTILPFYAGLVNKAVKGGTGQTPVMGVARRWVGMYSVLKEYMTVSPQAFKKALLKGETPENIAKMSRGIQGMQIEGQGFNSIPFKNLHAKMMELAGENPVARGFGHLLYLPMAMGNLVMNKGIIPTDDFFRRMALEGETRGVIHELYTKGLSDRPSVTQKVASSFENFKEYEKTMLPLFTDLKNTLFKTREKSIKETTKAMEAVYKKYSITRENPEFVPVLMGEIFRMERRAAETVSQETVNDFWLGRGMKKFLNEVESLGPMGRLATATMVPFQTAPLNLMRSSFEETPILNMLSERWWAKYKGSTKDKYEAIAQVLAGSSFLYAGWQLVNTFPVYGHIPMEEIREAQELGIQIQPNSIIIGSNSYSLDVLGTFKAPIAMLADYRRYEMGNAEESFLMAGKAFIHASVDTPYFDAMGDISAALNGDTTEAQWASILTSKVSQFAQPGAGIMRTIQAGRLGGAIEESRINEHLDEWYNNVWLRKLDNQNKNNPTYRFFRNMTDPQPYIKRTNMFGDELIRNGGSIESFVPYAVFGINNMPSPTSPGLVRLKELGIVNRDFTKIGDVDLDIRRAEQLKKQMFSDTGLGLKIKLDKIVMNDNFDRLSSKEQTKILQDLIDSHREQVISGVGLDVTERQRTIDDINELNDFLDYTTPLKEDGERRELQDVIYQMQRKRIGKARLEAERLEKALE
jgi:hypothetical protein